MLLEKNSVPAAFRKILLRPLISAAICGAAAAGAYLVLHRFLPGSLSTVLATGFAALVYVVALFRIRGFVREDVLMLPKGEALCRILTKLRLIRA